MKHSTPIKRLVVLAPPSRARANGIGVPNVPPRQMIRHPKGKGNEGEREICEILRKYGWPARRNFASGGQGGADIIGGPPDLAIEVKRTERATIWAWLEQVKAAARPTETPVVFFRRNRSSWYAVVPLDYLLELIAEREGKDHEH